MQSRSGVQAFRRQSEGGSERGRRRRPGSGWARAVVPERPHTLCRVSPRRAGRLEEAAGARLAAAVKREMGRAEALLKVVGSRPENLADNFFTLLPAATPADFQRIVDLKVPPVRRRACAELPACCAVQSSACQSCSRWPALPRLARVR